MNCIDSMKIYSSRVRYTIHFQFCQYILKFIARATDLLQDKTCLFNEIKKIQKDKIRKILCKYKYYGIIQSPSDRLISLNHVSDLDKNKNFNNISIYVMYFLYMYFQYNIIYKLLHRNYFISLYIIYYISCFSFTPKLSFMMS